MDNNKNSSLQNQQVQQNQQYSQNSQNTQYQQNPNNPHNPAHNYYGETIINYNNNGLPPKKKHKALLFFCLLGAILLIAGITLFIISFAMADFDFRNFSTNDPYIEKAVQFEGPIKSLYIDDKDAKLTIKRSRDDITRVFYSENDEYSYEISLTESSGKLNILMLHDYKFRLFNFDFYTREVTVELNDEDFETLNATTSNSKVNISDIFAKKDIKAKTSNDQIILNNVKSNANITLTTSNGWIIAEDVICTGHMNLNTSNDPIKLKNIVCEGDFFAKTSNSMIEAFEIEVFYELNLTTSNDNITVKYCTAQDIILNSSNGRMSISETNSKYLYAATSNSSINVDSINAEKIILKSSNDPIRGTIVGRQRDFEIKAKTSNSNCNLPNSSGGDKYLEIKTSNDEIFIEFVDD